MRAPSGTEIRGDPDGWTSRTGVGRVCAGEIVSFLFAVPIAVATPPPTRAPTAKKAARTIVVLGILSRWQWLLAQYGPPLVLVSKFVSGPPVPVLYFAAEAEAPDINTVITRLRSNHHVLQVSLQACCNSIRSLD